MIEFFKSNFQYSLGGWGWEVAVEEWGFSGAGVGAC